MKLNIGCSNYLLEGWENLDKKGTHCNWENSKDKDKIKEFDATQFPWEYEDNSVEAILFSHTLNQIPEKFHLKIFKECWRVLKDFGVVRIIDDDNENKKSCYYKEIHEHSETEMIPSKILKRLLKLGFVPYITDKDETHLKDKSICVDNHPRLDSNSKFFMEAIKWDISEM